MTNTTLNAVEALHTIQATATGLANAESDACAYQAIYQAALDTVHAKHLDTMRAHIARIAGLRGTLLQEISAQPELFQAPKSYKQEGLNYGFRVKPEQVVIVDENRLISSIDLDLAYSESCGLLRFEPKVNKPALKELPLSTLQKLKGVTYTPASDEPFITTKNSVRVPV